MDHMKTIISKIPLVACSGLRKIRAFFARFPFIACVVLAFLLNFTIETLSRRSLISAFGHIFASPLFFFCNVLIILATVCVGLLFRRRYFYFTLISALWLALGVTNFVLLNFRQTPLGAIDLLIVKSCIPLMTIYLNVFQIILICLLIAAALAVIVLMFFKAPKIVNVSYIKNAGKIAVTVAALAFVITIPVKAHITTDSFSNLPTAYSNFGFAYCFSRSLLDTGIDKPSEYNEDKIAGILDSSGKIDNSSANTDCNIILVQLESFIDISHMKNVTTSEDPTPVFNALKEKYTSGFLTVPSIGAGTANTEFEVLTSMSLDYFGTGEYPYKTILKSSTSESAAYILSELGYKTHVIHNHVASFYDRHLVYGNLGFDDYTPLEMMSGIVMNPTNWCEDSVLVHEITDCLSSSEEYDFIFGITVQTHGKYPTVSTMIPGDITAEGYGESEDDDIMFEYYLSQLNRCDAFIGDLKKALDDLGEPYILILYGDHIPAITIDEEDFDCSLFQTEYVICDNIGLSKSDSDIYTYQLMPRVFELLNFDGGVLTNYHQSCQNAEDYEENLEMLQYDILYGKKYAYGTIEKYSPKDLQFGTDDITVEAISYDNGVLSVTGGIFNEYSAICLNGNKLATDFIDENTLTASLRHLEDGDIITVIQYTHDYLTLYISDELVYIEDGETEKG